MLHKVLKALVNTTKTLEQVHKDLQDNSIELETVLRYLEQCSNCSQWKYIEELQEDLDNNPTCTICLKFYGY